MFWLWPVMAVMPELGWIMCASSNFVHPIQFRSSKEHPDHFVQNQPGSNLDGLVKLWGPNVSGPKTSWCARIIRPCFGRMWPAYYQFPTFRLGGGFPQTSQIVLRKTNLDLTWFWLAVLRFVQMDLVWKQVDVQESSGLLLAYIVDLDLMRIGSGMFTGYWIIHSFQCITIVSSWQVILTIESNQVTIIQGSTGSGKTTQVPQYILDHYAEKGEYCNIIVTQPRRIAAMSIAKRVCQERGWPLGSVCGYQVGGWRETCIDMLVSFSWCFAWVELGQISLSVAKIDSFYCAASEF